MNCQTFQENMTDLILPGAPARSVASLQAHAAACPACAQSLAALQTARDAVRPSHQIVASKSFKEGVMKHIHSMEQAETVRPRRILAWRPALAAALVLIVGCMALVSFLTRGGGGNNALAQAVAAARGVRFIHIKMEPGRFGSIHEMWAQFDEQGRPLHMRWEAPVTEDGPKSVHWQADKVEIYFKAKNIFNIAREPDVLKKMKMTADDFDPRVLLDRLVRAQQEGRAKIATQGTLKQVEPIRLTVTYTDQPGRRDVYLVDIPSHLVLQIEKFLVQDGKARLVERKVYLDYNKTVEPSFFALAYPGDAMVIDEVARPIGLPKGSLSDAEIAKKVVREFFEALIAKDWAKAGLLFGGLPAAQVQKDFGKLKVVRIVSIGEPVPFKLNNSLKVPCTVEIERDGKTETWTPYGPFVRPVYNQPDRWALNGGI